MIYLLIVWRGFKVATVAHDSFSKLLAAGLATVFALQVFVIVGGVTKVIPLTGVTLPFVSSGGSSIVANFILLALLLLVSDARAATRARISTARRAEPGDEPGRAPLSWSCSASRDPHRGDGPWTVVEADDLNQNALNKRPLLETARVPRGTIRTSDGRMLARSVKQSDGTYVRRYTDEARKASQFVGYSFTNAGTPASRSSTRATSPAR